MTHAFPRDVSAKSFPADHPKVAFGKIGVLLVNLGTPDDYDRKSMRRYLKEFLSDRRVIETPRLIWWPLLNGIILNTRPKKSAKAYAKVWTDRGSPLADITAGQADAIFDRFLAGTGNQDDFRETRIDRFLDDILNHGFVDDGQHFLRNHLARGQYARAETGHRDDHFRQFCHMLANNLRVVSRIAEYSNADRR